MSVLQHLVLAPGEGQQVWIAGLGARFMIRKDQTGGNFALVEHPLKPGTLASPLHTHTHEDEFSYILEGEVGVQIGDQEFVATPGMLVFKPRGIPHAFWNQTPQPARLLELISPAGFEKYFEEVADIFAQQGPALAALPQIAEKYGLTLHLDSIPALRKNHGLH
jgi:quercetin dioxygenase-like cupin family protein